MIFLVAGITENNSWEYYVFIFNSNWTYSENFAMQLKDVNNYQDELKEFKESNNWNKPYR